MNLFARDLERLTWAALKLAALVLREGVIIRHRYSAPASLGRRGRAAPRRPAAARHPSA